MIAKNGHAALDSRTVVVTPVCTRIARDDPSRDEAALRMTATYTAATTFNSTAIGVGSESTPTVVRVGWIAPKYSPYT